MPSHPLKEDMSKKRTVISYKMFACLENKLKLVLELIGLGYFSQCSPFTADLTHASILHSVYINYIVYTIYSSTW